MIQAVGLALGLSFYLLFKGERKSAPEKRIKRYYERQETTKKRSSGKKDRPFKAFMGRVGAVALFEKSNKKYEALLKKADVPLSVEELNALRFIGATLAFSLLAVFIQNLWLAISAFVLAWILPILYIKHLKNKREKAFDEQLGDALNLFANSLKAGYSYMQAVASVAKEMPDPLGKEFAILTKEMSLGIDADEALEHMRHRMDSEDLGLMITAIMIQRKTGGNLAEILENISETIRARLTIQGEIRTLTAQGRLSGVIIVLLPVFLGLIIFAMTPEYMTVLFTHPIGKILLVTAFISEMIGIYFIRKIIHINV
jgi:tight adherence protein B